MTRNAWSIVRSFGRAKGFAAAAALTVALGIGVNSIVFSLFDRLLFRPLPYTEPTRLVQVYSHMDEVFGYPSLETAVEVELAREKDLFSGIAEAPGGALVPMAPAVGENPLFWFTAATTNTLDVLGLRPVIGPGFSAFPASELDRPVLLTYDVWQQRYGGSADVLSLGWIARDAAQREVHWRVVGVLPKDFLLPAPQLTTAEFDGIYGLDPGFDRQLSLRVVGAAPFARLAPGVSRAAAQARVNVFMASRFPRLINGASMRLEKSNVTIAPLQSGLSTAARPYAWLAVAGAWAVLGATCLTLAILLLTWNQSRRQDAGVRLALGASPARLVVKALIESSLLCGVGAVIGWLAYTWGRPLFVSVLPPGLQAYASEPSDGRVIVLTCAIAVITAIVAGTLPAIRTSRTSPLDVLRSPQNATSVNRLVGGPVLLAVQATFGLVLLVGASATVPGVLKAVWQPPGFDASDLYTVHVPTSNDSTANDAREQVRRGREALDIIRSLPGVVAASLSRKDPLWVSTVETQLLGKPNPSGFAFPGRVVPVDRDLFAMVRNQLVAGRTFSTAEVEQQALVAIVNESEARLLSPGAPPQAVLGQTITTEDGPRVIVGVAEDFRVGMDLRGIPTLFLPLSAGESYRHSYDYSSYELVVRMASGRVLDVALFSDRLRDRPWMMKGWLGTWRESVAARRDLDLGTPRLLAVIFGTLGGITLLLAVIAIFGLASFEVRRRREEMTVRLALGATPYALRSRLAVVTVRPILVGVLAGLPLSWMQVFLLARSVPTIHAADPRIYVTAAATMIVVALAAAWVPGWRSITMRVAELLRSA